MSGLRGTAWEFIASSRCGACSDRGRIAGQWIKGEIVADAVWPAIITREQSETIRATLADPDRRTNKSARRYLLAGLVRCGLCGGKMVARPRAGGQRRYACVTDPGSGGCGRMTVNADPPNTASARQRDELVSTVEVAASLKKPAPPRPPRRPGTEIDEGQAQLVELGEAFANKPDRHVQVDVHVQLIDACIDAARATAREGDPHSHARGVRRSPGDGRASGT